MLDVLYNNSQPALQKIRKILSNPGYKSIHRIKIGDKIVTHKGRIKKKLVEIYKRKYNGSIHTVNVKRYDKTEQ